MLQFLQYFFRVNNKPPNFMTFFNQGFLASPLLPLALSGAFEAPKGESTHG